MEINHWNNYYTGSDLLKFPSPYCMELLNAGIFTNKRVVEFGCGNGRDGFTILKYASTYTGIDASKTAIDDCVAKLQSHDIESSDFLCYCVGQIVPAAVLNKVKEADILYTRFFLHALTGEELNKFHGEIVKNIKTNAHVYHEFRTINDKLFHEGQDLGDNARISGHYRRFLDIDEVKILYHRLGFEIIRVEESDKFAILGEDRPVVCRFIAKKL